jgi:sensor histidine kinase regulating citrate/malate metabolism
MREPRDDFADPVPAPAGLADADQRLAGAPLSVFSQGALLLDAAGTVVAANEPALDWFALQEPEALGRWFPNLWHEPPAALVRALSVRDAAALVVRDSEGRPLRLNLVPVEGERTLVTFREVNECSRLKIELASAEREIEQLQIAGEELRSSAEVAETMVDSLRQSCQSWAELNQQLLSSNLELTRANQALEVRLQARRARAGAAGAAAARAPARRGATAGAEKR